MEFYLDSADEDEIRRVSQSGIIRGVTTNPSLIKKAMSKLHNDDMELYIKNVLAMVGRERKVSLEVIGLIANEMASQGERLFAKFNSVAGNVVIKIPVNTSIDAKGNHYEGLNAINRLSANHIPVNATLIMTPEQALLAAKAGAQYVSPFAGRIDDFLRSQPCDSSDRPQGKYYQAHGFMNINDFGIVSGVDLIARIVDVFKKSGVEAKVLAASVRSPLQVRELILAGADIVTVPFDVFSAMLCHNKTYEGIEKFTADVVPEYAALFASRTTS